MRIKEIITLLKNTKERVNLRLYFTRKGTEQEYESFSPGLGKGVAEVLLPLIIENLEKKKELPVSVFSPLGHYDETIEKCISSDIHNFRTVMDSYKEDRVERDGMGTIEIGKLTFYCLSMDWLINGEERNIKFFRRVTKFRKLSSKGILGQIRDNRFVKLEEETLGLDCDIDLIVSGDEVLILNHVALERIFSVSDQYTKKASEAIEKIRKFDKIQNFEQFKEDCLHDGRVCRILTKLQYDEKILEKCLKDFRNVKRAIDEFELNIKTKKIKNREMLVYEGKEQLMDIVRIIRDSYYISIVQNRKGIDESL